MSSYLTIKKNGVDLISWCRSSEQYQALKNSGKVPFMEFKEFKPDDLNCGIIQLEEEVKQWKKQIEMREKISSNISYEDACDWINDLKEWQEGLEEKEYALNNLRFLKDICEESVWQGDVENEVEVPIKLEWRYD